MKKIVMACLLAVGLSMFAGCGGDKPAPAPANPTAPAPADHDAPKAPDGK